MTILRFVGLSRANIIGTEDVPVSRRMTAEDYARYIDMTGDIPREQESRPNGS